MHYKKQFTTYSKRIFSTEQQGIPLIGGSGNAREELKFVTEEDRSRLFGQQLYTVTRNVELTFFRWSSKNKHLIFHFTETDWAITIRHLKAQTIKSSRVVGCSASIPRLCFQKWDFSSPIFFFDSDHSMSDCSPRNGFSYKKDHETRPISVPLWPDKNRKSIACHWRFELLAYQNSKHCHEVFAEDNLSLFNAINPHTVLLLYY